MDKSTNITIQYPDGGVSSALVTFVGPNEAKLETDPMSCLFAATEEEIRTLPDFGDLVELEKVGRNKYRFVRVIERAGFERFEYLLSDPEVQAAKIEPVLTRVLGLGGNWERVFGGVLTIFLPKDCGYDPREDMVRLLGEPKPK